MNGQGSSSSGKPQRISFDQLVAGEFQHDPLTRQMHPATRTSYYRSYDFKDGRPVYVFSRGDSLKLLSELRQAHADFGGFHARNKGTGNLISIGSEPVHEDKDAQSFISRVFSENVNSLVRGDKRVSSLLQPVGERFEGHPNALSYHQWSDILNEVPDDQSHSLKKLLRKLGTQRYLHFKNREGSLAIRAYADGRFESKLFDAAGRIIKF